MKIKKFNEMFDPMGSWNPKQLKNIRTQKEILEYIINKLSSQHDIDDVKYSSVFGEEYVSFFNEIPYSISFTDRGKTIIVIKEVDGITDVIGSYDVSDIDDIISDLTIN